MGNSEGRRSLGRHKCRWKNNITIDIHERGLGTLNASMWLRIGQLAGSYEGSNEPLSSIKFGKFLD